LQTHSTRSGQAPDSIKAYESYIKIHPLPGKKRIASENTRAAYVLDLTLFARWFQDTTEQVFAPASITREDIQDYIAHVRTVQDAAVNTVKRKYASIRSFYQWAIATGQAQYNESNGVALPSEQRLAPEGLDRPQRAAVRRVFNAPPKNTPTAGLRQVRDRAIVFVMMYAGLRISEIENLRLEDVILREKSGEIDIRSGKGDKDRTIALPLEARKALEEWLAKRPETDHKFVFTTTRRGHAPLGRRAIQEMVSDVGRKAELDKAGIRLTPHLLRHTAVYLWREENDPFVVAAQMGHKDINTTMRYGRPSGKDLRRAAAKIR
jgi:site-specific recombinase XerD